MKKIFILLAAGFLFILCGKEKNEEISRLREELQSKQREIERLSGALTDRENELKKLRIWLANIVADGRITTVSEREQRLMTGVKTLADASEAMVIKSMNFSELLRPKLNALPLSSADRVRLVMALEELERSAARVNSVAGIGRNRLDFMQQIRVVAVRPELGMAVISAGGIHGIFPGMIFNTLDGRIKLRVAEIRPQVSGVTAIRGDLRNLVPGSMVRLQVNRVQSEDPLFRQKNRL